MSLRCQESSSADSDYPHEPSGLVATVGMSGAGNQNSSAFENFHRAMVKLYEKTMTEVL